MKNEGNHFKYPAIVENYNEKSIGGSRNSLYDQTQDQLRISDSGIDSSQTSPNPNIEISPIQSPRPTCPTSPVSPLTKPGDRKKSCSLLHPDHARFLAYRQSICSDQVMILKTVFDRSRLIFIILSRVLWTQTSVTICNITV
jgi:hypothetical protein